jgi:hypothetical protein
MGVPTLLPSRTTVQPIIASSLPTTTTPRATTFGYGIQDKLKLSHVLFDDTINIFIGKAKSHFKKHRFDIYQDK